MKKDIIETKNAPKPIGPYSQAIASGGLVFVSGQIAIDPKSGDVINTSITEETKQVMQNISAILASEGLGFSDIVKTTIFLTNMEDFTEVNATYGSFFIGDFPARETVEVSRLPKNVRVEISVIASR